MPSGLTLRLTSRPGSALVTVSGELDLPGYASLRDGLLKVAADTPPGIVADVSALTMDELAPASVFPLVARRIDGWPGIPLSLVTNRRAHARLLRASGIDRFVAVHPDVETAEHHQSTPIRRRVARTLPRTAGAAPLARSFVRELAGRWNVPELVYDGTLIAGELADNAVRHTSSIPEVRLDLRRGLLTVAVADDDPRPAVLLERPDVRSPGVGLAIVAHAATVWGSSRRWSGGKVVWAVLTSARHRERGEPV
ncbi:ATP-binding protein [Amycolatopsis sp. NBC_01286]|uniref:ATP-binding protein n=1 Tax=Amycolatopsis sp. NBC_01286 TaxID=2903560 RepID=UPI002E11E36C|nr:ATP-binding protein [Amycolatopsis sp. NBC_01286]